MFYYPVGLCQQYECGALASWMTQPHAVRKCLVLGGCVTARMFMARALAYAIAA